VGARESALSLTQTALFIERVKQEAPEAEFEIRGMTTQGDRRAGSLALFGGKGLFVRELNNAVLAGELDLAVHSLKDMPVSLEPGLRIAWYSRREDPRDTLVLPLSSQPCCNTHIDCAVRAGTSSPRRACELKRLYPRWECAAIRGNVITRLKKLDAGEYGALVLAAAGLKRLGLEARIVRYFEVDEIVPAAAQGILCAVARADREMPFLLAASDRAAAVAAAAERAFVRGLGADCASPVGAYCRVDGEAITLRGVFYDAAGTRFYREHAGSAVSPEDLGTRAAETLLNDIERGVSK